MPSRVIKTKQDLDGWVRFLQAQDLPVTVSVAKGAKRTNPQNALIHKHYEEIAKQREDVTSEWVRAESKLMFGVPILRRDDAGFRDWYDASFKPLPYGAKVELFLRLDPCITSKMTVKQLGEYLDNMGTYYRDKGFVLTDPALQGMEDMR